MDTHLRPARLAVVVGIVLGLAGGSYGIASAASGSGSTAATTTTSGLGSSAGTSQAGPTQEAAPSASNAGPSGPWGGERSDETLLTGDAKAKVQAAALAKVTGGTIVRIETDADGHAAYEAHMTKQDGTPVTVYIDKQYNVVSVESR